MTSTVDIRTEAKYAQTKLGYLPDILNPRSFNEHILYNKFFLRDPLLITTTDKIAVNDYVSQCGFADLIIPNYHVTDNVKDIPFDIFPKRYIIKPNQLSGSIIYVNYNENREVIRKTCAEWLKIKHYGASRFIWCTQFIKPKIIFQKIIGQNPHDYKFHVINNRVEFISVHTSRGIGIYPKKNISYDRDWNVLPFTFQQELAKPIMKPLNLKSMITIAEILSRPFQYVRVDLYEVEGKIYFGELTHFPNSGAGKFTPESWDYKYGKLWPKH